jgi:hypothetical protein
MVLLYGRIGRGIRRPWWLLGTLCVGISLLGFNYREDLAELFNPSFGDVASYPTIISPFDISGYLKVIGQGLLDPISISSISSAGFFGVFDATFFALALLAAIRAMSCPVRRLRGLLISILVTLWAFAYFEVFVSGYSRHRLGPFVALIACLAIAFNLPSAKSVRGSLSGTYRND